MHKRSIKVSYSGDKGRLPRSARGHGCHPRPHQMPPDVQNSRKPPCCSPPRSASREFRWTVPRTTGSRPRAAVFLQTLSPQGLYECACVCTSVRACVRVCIRMLGAVLMHLAGRGRTAECPAVCERHCLMQLRTVLLTMPQRPCGEAGLEKRIDLLVARCVVTGTSRCTERGRPSRSFLPSSGRGRRRAHTHTPPDTWRACHECAAGVTWLARQAA